MNSSDIERRLCRLGNGACVAIWNGSFDVQMLDSANNGPVRRVLASGGNIDEALFDRAEARAADLKQAGVWPCREPKLASASTAPVRVRIVKCSAGSGAWYEGLIGNIVTIFAQDNYGWWTRDTGPMRCSQWIKTEDAELVGADAPQNQEPSR